MKIDYGPREKLIKYGVEKLEDEELLALLIKTGSKEQSVIELSKDILLEIDSINNLSDFKFEELICYNGIGVAKASTICAALELSNRIIKRKQNVIKIETVYDIVRFVYSDLYNLNHERLICIFLNNSMKVISKQIFQDGNSTNVIFDINEIIKRALRLNAKAVITVHNHPSGIEYPSEKDLYLFNNLENKLQEFNIIMFDNVVFTDNTYYSNNFGRKVKKIDLS